MLQNAPVWLVIALAFFMANLPFVNQRLFAVMPIHTSRKPFGLRLLEMALLYGLLGLFARWLESRTGRINPQGWEFFAVTGALFVTCAFPGFVFQYLIKRRG